MILWNSQGLFWILLYSNLQTVQINNHNNHYNDFKNPYLFNPRNLNWSLNRFMHVREYQDFWKILWRRRFKECYFKILESAKVKTYVRREYILDSVFCSGIEGPSYPFLQEKKQLPTESARTVLSCTEGRGWLPLSGSHQMVFSTWPPIDYHFRLCSDLLACWAEKKRSQINETSASGKDIKIKPRNVWHLPKIYGSIWIQHLQVWLALRKSRNWKDCQLYCIVAINYFKTDNAQYNNKIIQSEITKYTG